MTRPRRRFITRPKVVVIRSRITKVVSVRAKVSHGSEVKDLRESNLHISLIGTRVRLVGLFILFFILLILVNQVIVIILARVATSLLEEPILDF